MKTLFDTSVLVAALVQPHPRHAAAVPWLRRAKEGEFDIVVAAHTLAELYAVLTTLSVSPRISPAMAMRLIKENVESVAKVIALSSADYSAVLRGLGDLGLSGGIVYDALILRAALKAHADRLLTFNLSDFRRLTTDNEITIAAP